MNPQTGIWNRFPGMYAISVTHQAPYPVFVSVSSAEDGDVVPVGMMSIISVNHAEES